MSVAPDLSSLKKRLDRYFGDENKSKEMERLRDIRKRHLDQFENVGVVGGLVRDFARGGRSAFKSDLDLVIEASSVEVACFAEHVGASPNRFGGYGFVDGPWKIDFWALERTWAATSGHVQVNHLPDVIRSTFFDWDAVVYDIKRKKLSCDIDYLERIRSSRLEINLRANPSELGNLLRAARRIIRWGLEPGPILRSFIVERLDGQAFDRMRAEERRKFSFRVTDEYDDAEKLRHALLIAPRCRAKDPDQMDMDFESNADLAV